MGFLYLHSGDFELANHAFYRAQVLDPDYALAWVGQAMVATHNEHDIEAMALLEHSTRLSIAVVCTVYYSEALHPLIVSDGV